MSDLGILKESAKAELNVSRNAIAYKNFILCISACQFS
jgi:hypothetical protein